MATWDTPNYNSPGSDEPRHTWKEYDWDWLKDSGFGGDPQSTLEGVYSGGGGLNRAIGRGVVSDWFRSQEANNAALMQKRQNLQGMYDYRDRSDMNFANQQAQIGEKEEATLQSMQDTQASVDESMNQYHDKMTGYMDKIGQVTKSGSKAMGEWGDKAVAKMEESSEEFKDFSTQQASALARGGAAKLQAQNAQLDASNMPENVKASMRSLNQRQFDQDIFTQQTALQNQAQQTQIGLDQMTASAYSQRGQVEGAAAQLETSGLAQGAQASGDFWKQKAGLDAQLGASRSEFRQFMTGMEQQSHQAYAERDLQVQQLIASGEDSLAEAISTNPVSLLDGLAGLANLYSSSSWAARTLSNVWVPGNRSRVKNPDYKEPVRRWY